jgi:hypothetical protein
VRGIKDAILSDQVLYKTFEADVTQELVDHVFTSNGVEEARLATINEQDLARPGVMILWRDMSSVLIDGNHRLVAGWRMGRTVFRYVGVPIGRELVPYVCRPGGEDKFFEIAPTSGVRLDNRASAAIEIGRATSGIAKRAFGSPSARTTPASSRSNPGNAPSGASARTPVCGDIAVTA